MKKLLCLLLAVLCLTASFVGCGKGDTEKDGTSEESTSVSDTVLLNDTDNPEAKGKVIETELFTVTVSDDYYENVKTEIISDQYGYSLCFYEKKNSEEYGGWLMSLNLFPMNDEYTYQPSYWLLGTVLSKMRASYYFVVTYPTDVQFSEEHAADYQKYVGLNDEVIKSVTWKSNSIFTPMEEQ